MIKSWSKFMQWSKYDQNSSQIRSITYYWKAKSYLWKTDCIEFYDQIITAYKTILE